MAEQWIRAKPALQIAGSSFTLCERLHAGLIKARAGSLHIGERREENASVPKEFWWAEGHAALETDWETGDFSTWIDEKIKCRAFGVTIAVSGLLDLVAIEERAGVLRSLSVAGHGDWVNANAAHRVAYIDFDLNPSSAGSVIIDYAKIGLISARALLAEGSGWEEREWDIPTWFWQNFCSAESSNQSWPTGRFVGRGMSPKGSELITLTGVHFLRSSLAALGPGDALSAAPAPKAAVGRKPTYDWEAATTAIWGKIHRGELIPESQAEVERALIFALAKGDKEPSESTVRPYASRIWDEISKA